MSTAAEESFQERCAQAPVCATSSNIFRTSAGSGVSTLLLFVARGAAGAAAGVGNLLCGFRGFWLLPSAPEFLSVISFRCRGFPLHSANAAGESFFAVAAAVSVAVVVEEALPASRDATTAADIFVCACIV